VHDSAELNLRLSLKKWVSNDPVLSARGTLKVLDVGAADVNGSSRDLFDRLGCLYHGVDLEPRPGVDTVLDDPYRLPFDDGRFDVAVTCSTFEHSEQFWRLFAEMARVTADDGILIVIVPSAGPVHRYPVDCYRFFADSMPALAAHGGIRLLEARTSPFGPWHDTVGVFRKTREDSLDRTPVVDLSLRLEQPVQNTYPPGVPDEVEHGAGTSPSYDLLSRLHQLLKPRFYAEVGVAYGTSLIMAQCPSLGIDPAPELTVELTDRHRLCRTTSDDFFFLTDEPSSVVDLDLAYVDGMHQIEFAMRDFMYMERLSHPGTVIVIDDIYPAHPLQGERIRQSRYWTGDIWKIINLLRSARPDLVLLPMNTSPTGSLIVVGCDPTSDVLWEKYDVLMAWLISSSSPPPEEITSRSASFEPDDPLVTRVLSMIADARGTEHFPEVMARVRRLVEGSRPRRLAPA